MAQIDEQGRAIRQVVPLEGMRKVIAERMTFSKHEYPQGTGQVHLEVSRVMQFRKELLEQKGIKVSFGDLYVKAAACALEENMALNASRQNGQIIYYEDININVLASFNGVLMEPVLEHVDRKDIEEVSAELKKTYEYLKKADVDVQKVNRLGQAHPNLQDMIQSGSVDMIVNTPQRRRQAGSDGIKIRRMAVEHSILCLTSLDTAHAILTARERAKSEDLTPIDITTI